MNAFTEGKRKLIPAVLIYARSKDRVLMMHRDRQGDHHLGKWNGLGGKMEADESPLQAMVREWREESGLSFSEDRFKIQAVLQFPNFIPQKNQDWIVYLGTTQVNDSEAGKIPGRNSEGVLEWVPSDKLLELNLWEGDRKFIPQLLLGKSFLGTFWYEGERVKRHWLSDL